MATDDINVLAITIARWRVDLIYIQVRCILRSAVMTSWFGVAVTRTRLTGSDGSDVIYGNPGNDLLSGGGDKDLIFGGQG